MSMKRNRLKFWTLAASFVAGMTLTVQVVHAATQTWNVNHFACNGNLTVTTQSGVATLSCKANPFGQVTVDDNCSVTISCSTAQGERVQRSGYGKLDTLTASMSCSALAPAPEGDTLTSATAYYYFNQQLLGSLNETP